MFPARSPYSLIQEDLWPSEWWILVSCQLLNQTSRKQVERVLPVFRQRWPDPHQLAAASPADVAVVCRPLGFANRRTTNLQKMAAVYVSGQWEHARELPGIGEYGGRSWEIFCRGILGDEPPRDHALVQYWLWRKQLVTRCDCDPAGP